MLSVWEWQARREREKFRSPWAAVIYRAGLRTGINLAMDSGELGVSARLFAKISATMALPHAERKSRIKLAIHNRSASLIDSLVFSSIGYAINRWEWKFIVHHRPEFHQASRNFPEYKRLFKSWIAGNSGNCGDMARFYLLYQNIHHVLEEGVSGDLVELGVYKGNSAKILAVLGQRKGRQLYLFDTFEGFDRRDLSGVDCERTLQFSDTSLAAVQRLVGTENVTYVKGSFPESAGRITMPAHFAVAHIDCDLYNPMRAGLECFYPRLSKGGLLILHDYSSGQWPGATRAIDEFFADRPEKPVLMPDRSGTAIIRKV